MLYWLVVSAQKLLFATLSETTHEVMSSGIFENVMIPLINLSGINLQEIN